MSALAFTLLALLLVAPVPALLARARWPLRAPRAALVLWQAVALAAVLSAFSAGIATASRLLMPGPDGRPTSTIAGDIGRLGWPLWLLYVGVLTVTVLIGVRFMLAVLQVMISTRRRRARHRMLVDLLGTNSPAPPGHPPLRVLDIHAPLAYCLPGRHSRVVLSEGALTDLATPELAAILSHERAHLRARHDLVLEAFTAVHTAFPRVVRSANALGAVRLLIEVLADDAALRRTGPAPLGRALVACAAGPVPAGALGAGDTDTVLRVRRLAGRPNSRAFAAAAYIAAVGIVGIPTVALAVPWLVELQRLLLP
ncbi:Zn-dependent protease with chaperone function [Mycolicibacillus koreensis]|nr:Zn-dependent protease with chaperone function [Mycolicibacillus koreensis]